VQGDAEGLVVGAYFDSLGTGENREGEHRILSSHWDNWGREKRMRDHRLSSFAQRSKHTKYEEEAPCWLHLLWSGPRRLDE
jgi:hypothetical protein